MNKSFVEFQRFSSKTELEKGIKILAENNIEYIIEDVSVNLDPVLSSNKLGLEFLLKIEQVNFEKANKILDEFYSFEIDEIENDYYLFSFSDDELLEVIIKSDEWNKFDVQLAQKILRLKGKGLSNLEIDKIRAQRIIELSKPEKKQSIWIFVGYISSILGGLLGIFIGWHLLTFKKTLPNGNRIYNYSNEDRKHGNQILILGILSIIIWILIKIIFS
ncbi:MAG: hypothetical protein KA523_05480 [Flavobacterium sp.]|jgi:hypothetical protein|nr:hypothetical protein [Flavobacterium sp.]